MLIAPVKNPKELDRALKVLKSKVNKSGLMRELKERMEYKKPSEKRREEKAKAIYRQRFIDDENKK